MDVELPWYAQLRAQHRPDKVRLLLIAESAPDPGAAERRFFYAPVLDARDNLFRGVITALYGCSPGRAGDSKATFLARLKRDGVFLIDHVPYPVNKLSARDRAKALRDHVVTCVEAARGLAPSGLVVCHSPSFELLARPLRDAGLKLLHDTAIPFPRPNWRARFVVDVRAALARLPWDQALPVTRED